MYCLIKHVVTYMGINYSLNMKRQPPCLQEQNEKVFVVLLNTQLFDLENAYTYFL